MPLRKEVDLEKTVAAASGVFRDVCSEKPPYNTAEELWEGLKQGDEGARLLFVFFLRLRKNERTRCSVEKAIAAEGKRWVGVLIEEDWRLYLLMRHRAVPYQGKSKSVVAVEGSRAFLNAECVYVPWVRWCAEPTCTIQAHWPRRGVPNFPPSLLIPKGSNHYKQVLVTVLLVLTQQGPLKAGFKRKLSELIPQRSVLEEQREANTLRNVRRRLENMQ